ncbi:pre-mRNA splicing factor component-domain-containing protein [Boletus reticuloceps]|uniref:Pre-mRNA splicing factor component-domain-containing protein n=1 Tax=Boletus reticuloceps TaxID=495285 RepID=A0A8I3ADC9_9AGAM|nr:pre-mRNA splicing factor component-domain-containing protein [Boletus reticuloceps]
MVRLQASLLCPQRPARRGSQPSSIDFALASQDRRPLDRQGGFSAHEEVRCNVACWNFATPRGVGATPLRTLRDNLSINPTTGMVSGGETPHEQRLRADSAKRTLKTGFMNLPKPENNFELLVPEDEEEEQTSDPMFEEDAAERDGRLERMREEEEQRILARRSKPVQLGLPRPACVDVVQLLHDLNIGDNDELTDACKLINSELILTFLRLRVHRFVSALWGQAAESSLTIRRFLPLTH